MADEEDTKYWIYAGGLPYQLTEGDVVCVFSQFGEITEMTLVRDKETGISRGFGFIKYEDPRSCEVAVDNFNGTQIVGRSIKVSFASNLQALRNSKTTLIAPKEGSTLPIVEKPRSSPPAQHRNRMIDSRRSRSPVYNYRDDNRRHRDGAPHDAIDYHNGEDRVRRSPRETHSQSDYYDRDRRDYGDSRCRDRETDRSRYKESYHSHRRRDSRDRSDRDRSRYTRSDNIERSDHKTRRSEYSPGDSRDRRRRRGRSRSFDRSPRRSRSPERRHHHSNFHRHRHSGDDIESRHRHRRDSRDRKAYN